MAGEAAERGVEAQAQHRAETDLRVDLARREHFERALIVALRQRAQPENQVRLRAAGGHVAAERQQVFGHGLRLIDLVSQQANIAERGQRLAFEAHVVASAREAERAIDRRVACN
jgi:hypothetical protein